MLAIAKQLFDAVEANDIEALQQLYTDDVAVWHNYDDAAQSKAQNLQTLGSIPDRYDTFTYDEVREQALPDGFLRQHVIVAGRGGKTARVPAIMRVYVDGAQISRIEEYFDYGQLTRQLT